MGHTHDFLGPEPPALVSFGLSGSYFEGLSRILYMKGHASLYLTRLQLVLWGCKMSFYCDFDLHAAHRAHAGLVCSVIYGIDDFY